ncbi:MAG: cytidine deaminase [Prolixibacteraceae bacterium]|nr:cytidine deaminase [Prolixibacteraceae bacterium]
MEWKEIKISYREYDGIDRLPDEWKWLVEKAREVAKNAWAPYSNFNVGAAVKLTNGVILTGNNQENAAYPDGLCAERTALFYANANYPNDAVEVVAVTAGNANGWLPQPVTPCGSCRQVFLEIETRFGKPIKIILAGEEKVWVFDGADSIIPFNFTAASML